MPRAPSGGVKVVYQYANYLASRNHEVFIIHPATLFYIDERNSWLLKARSAVIAGLKAAAGMVGKYDEMSDWINPENGVVVKRVPTLIYSNLPAADIYVATLWRTAEYLAGYNLPSLKKRYFVQHYEDWSGSKNRVDRTWRFPIKKIVVANWLLKKGIEIGASNISVCQNGYDQREFYVTIPVEERNPQSLALMYSPHDWKGWGEGFAALREAKNRLPGLIVKVFSVYAPPAGLPDWVTFYRNPPRSVLRDQIYNGSAIFLCPSWSEGWGLPVLEAMACGCAIISTNNGGVEDFLINDKHGLIVPPKDHEAITRAIVEMVQDSAKIIAFAESSALTAKEFSLERSSAMFEKILACAA